MYSHYYRLRSTPLSVSVSSSATTGLTIGDATGLMNHDVLQLIDSSTGNTEFVQLSADPLTSTTIQVTRGVAGTTAQSSYTVTGTPPNTTAWVIGNSRTGAEVNQTGLTTVGVSRTQYCQTFQYPVQVGGSAQTALAQVLPGGIQTPFDFNMTIQLQNMVDDMENAIYYGKSQAPTDTITAGVFAGNTAMMNGLKSIITTNNTTAPTNASAYAPTDLIRDTLQAARTGGGEPDLLVLSTNWMSGLALWGMAVQRVPAGETFFGTPINVIEAPFLHGVTIVEAPLLRPYTAIALTSSEVYIRNKRNPYFQQRGVRGDMVEGDWLAELAVEVVDMSICHRAA